MHPLLKKITAQNEKKIISLEACFQNEGNLLFRYIEFAKKKKGIHFSLNTSGLLEMDALKGKWKKETALVLTLTGRGIITKRVEKGEQFRFSLRQIIPNASEEDFYFQCNDQEKYILVSLVRKSQVDPLLEELKKQGFILAAFYLGAPAALSLGIVLDRTELNITGATLQWENGMLEKVLPFAETPANETIDGTEIPGEELLCAGAGFSYYLNSDSLSEVEHDWILHCNEELSYRNLLHGIGFGSLAVILLLLLFNQYVFSHYQERHVLLEQVLGNSASERAQLLELKNELSEKQQLIASTGLFNPVKISFYTDQISQTVPQEIVLTTIAVYPLEKKKLSSTEKAAFISEEIIIEGIVSNTPVLNNWVRELKQLSWATEVTIDKYNQLQEKPGASFSIHVKVA